MRFRLEHLALLTPALLIYAGLRLNAADRQVKALQNIVAERDSLRTVGEGLKERLAVSLDGERQLSAIVESQSTELARRSRELRTTKRAYTSLQASFDSLRAQGPGTVTVYVDSSGKSEYLVDYEFRQPGISGKVVARVLVDSLNHVSSDVSVAAEIRPITLRILLHELKDGTFSTTVETDPWVQLGALNTYVNRQQLGLYERARPYLFAGAAVSAWEGLRRGRVALLIPAGILAVLEVVR